MIEGLIHFLQTTILPLGVVGVFLASVIEEVVAPIPSALIMTMSGFIFVSGSFSIDTILALLFKVALPAALGVTIGSYFVYFIARYGGKILIERWGKYIGLYWSDIEKLQSYFSGTKKDDLIIGGARVLPFFPSVAISAFCGLIQMHPLKYFAISFIGVFFRGVILGIVGWQVGNVYAQYAVLIGKLENVVLISTVVAILWFFVIKYRSK